MNMPSVFERYRGDIEAEMRSVFPETALPVYGMVKYHLGWQDGQGKELSGPGGKALRPTACLLACEAVSGDYRPALPAAAAMELVHNFSLVHDDIQDGDRERRHRPTVWSLWGKPQAINSGLAMRVLASLCLNRLGERGVPFSRQLPAQRLLDMSCLEMIEGQYLDLSYEDRLDITTADYLTMIDKKTAALIACSLGLGAVLATDNDRLPARFQRLGRNLGLAFQIKDDILGIWGDEKVTGKSRGNDIRRRKKSFPIVYLFEELKGKAGQDIRRIYGKDSIGDDDLETVWKVLDAIGARDYCQKTADRYCQLALDETACLDVSAPAKQDLEDLIRFLAARES